MLRINQFAKEQGVSNHDVIEVLEKRLGIPGKSHSSNLSEDQIALLRRAFDAKNKGGEESAPLALHKPTAPVRIVKAAPAPAPAPVAPPPPAPAVLVKKAPEPTPAPQEATQSPPPRSANTALTSEPESGPVAPPPLRKTAMACPS